MRDQPDKIAIEVLERPQRLDAVQPGAADQSEQPLGISWQELREMDISVDWLVEGLIPRASLGMLSGDPGVGKSWVALALAKAVATGTEAWEKFTVGSAGPVLYVDEESSHAEVQRRASRLEFPDDAQVTFVIQRSLRLDVDNSLGALRREIERVRPALVILDSITRLHGRDENQAQEVAGLMRTLSQVVRDFDCTVIFLHHHRKPSQGVRNTPENAPRGSVDYRAAVDFHIALTRTSSGLKATVTKLRQSVQPPDFMLERRDEGKSTIVAYVNGGQANMPTKAEEAVPLVKEELKARGQCTRQELVAALAQHGFTYQAVDRALGLLGGQVGREREGRELILCWVGEPSPEPSPI